MLGGFFIPFWYPKFVSMKHSILILIGLLFVAGCSPTEKQEDITYPLDSLFSNTLPANEPGGAILIKKGEKVIFQKAYGLADLNTKEPIRTNTLFNLGSISKTFVANAVLMLQAEGKLSVEDSIDKYFPGFKNKEIAKRVKIKHLLTHTSGLPDSRPVEAEYDFYLTAKDQENWYPVTQTDTLVFEPGTRFEYSNPAFNGLALIVEQVSKMKWQTYVQEKILNPAGMSTSTITDGAHPETGVAHAYLRQGDQWAEKDYGEEPTFAAAGNGGVWSSVEELAKYEQSLKNAIFLNDSIIARSRTITPWNNWLDPIPPFIGWSWFINHTVDGFKTVGHTGSQGGFLCNYVTVPEKDILFVILCNTPRDVDGYTEFITNWLIKNEWLEKPIQ